MESLLDDIIYDFYLYQLVMFNMEGGCGKKN